MVNSFAQKEYTVKAYSGYAGVGRILDQIESGSMVSCTVECSIQPGCHTVNYVPTNQTCALLHLEDVVDDWKSNPDVDWLPIGFTPQTEGKRHICKLPLSLMK